MGAARVKGEYTRTALAGCASVARKAGALPKGAVTSANPRALLVKVALIASCCIALARVHGKALVVPLGSRGQVQAHVGCVHHAVVVQVARGRVHKGIVIGTRAQRAVRTKVTSVTAQKKRENRGKELEGRGDEKNTHRGGRRGGVG